MKSKEFAMILKSDFSVFSKFRQELMGIAILGVCLLHAFDWAGIGDSVIAKVISPFARIAFTDGFLFLSGFGLYYSFSKNGDLCQFYLKRVNRVLLPYMIMGLPFFLLSLITDNISLSTFLLKLTSLYFWFGGNDGMWYISMSVALYFLFPIVYRFLFIKQKEQVILAKTLLVIITCVGANFVLLDLAPHYFSMVQIGVTKAPMFFIGMLVGWYSCLGRSMSWKHIVGAILLSLTILLKKKSDVFIPYYEMVYRLIMMPLACLALGYFNTKCLKTILLWFGRYSLEIYVLQMLIIGVAQKALILMNCPLNLIPALHTLLTFVIVMGFCTPIHNCIDKIIKKIENIYI